MDQELESQLEALVGKKPEGTASRSSNKLVICLAVTLGLLLVVLAGAWFGIKSYLNDTAKNQMLHINAADANWAVGLNMEELVTKSWWPGCGYVESASDIKAECAEPCYDPKILLDMAEYNKNNPGKVVYYSSRPHEQGAHKFETVKLGGWWLPAAGTSKEPRPRIVVQHGFKENSNYFRPVLLAYMLRKLGFDVLLNNFRDHGMSSNSSIRYYRWGGAYPMDVLGAWDYAREDPDGIMGGKLPTSRVGIAGFSKGAFITVQAFGIESEVPGVWVDGPPFEPKTVFSHGATLLLESLKLGFLAPLLLDSAWESVEDEALAKGVDLNYHKTVDTLRRGPKAKRPIFVVANEKDSTVPAAEHDKLMDLLGRLPGQVRREGQLGDDQDMPRHGPLC
eukprot:SRR837773.7200.p1 GENE.SRR837773.7200~~SRR837773.7200.p1  ORF type:complete len:427 (+),score=168.60 SRR837773.7200:103-1281(+)